MKLIFVITLALLCLIAGCKSSLSDECLEQPKENCMCTRQYDPVCGCNKKTYGNSCEAECNGVLNYTKGECKGKSDS